MKFLKSITLLMFVFSFTGSACSGQTSQSNNTTTQRDSITGDWKGSSLCQVKNSPCHDEIAMYHVSTTEKENVYRFEMNKIVNGQEEKMGTLDYLFDPTKRNLTSVYQQTSTWTFAVSGDNMHGSLIYKNVLYRVIDLKRLN
jgi:hypothetical protein